MNVRLMLDGELRPEREKLTALAERWQSRHLQSLLDRLGFPSGVLTAHVRSLPGEESYRVHVHLPVPPRKRLFARGEAETTDNALQIALRRLQRELRRHLHHINHQYLYKQKQRRQRLKEMKSQVSPATGIHAEIEALLPRLEGAIKRELAFLRSQDAIPPGFPAYEEIRDEVILSAERDWGDRTRERSLLSWLLGILSHVLDKETRLTLSLAEMTSTSQIPDRDATDTAEDMVGEERYEFWQPDEVVRIEDLIPSGEDYDPEYQAELVEQLHFFYQTVADLPTTWRRALFLYYLEDLPLGEVVEALNADESTVTDWLDSALDFVKARLDETGLDTEETLSLGLRRQEGAV